MGFDPEKDKLQKEETRRKILEGGFRIFSQRPADSITMTAAAQEMGIGVATLYRYYRTKPELLLAISAWAWERHISGWIAASDPENTGAERFKTFLDSFIDLYENKKDLLRFNQYFNIYMQGRIPSGSTELSNYTFVMDQLSSRLQDIYVCGIRDGTLRSDLSYEMISAYTLDLMVAAITRYAVGTVYRTDKNPEAALRVARELIYKEIAA